jgi:TonB-dependent receptor
MNFRGVSDMTTNTRARLLGTAAAAALLLMIGHTAQAQNANAGSNVEMVTVTGTRDQAMDVKRQANVVLDIAPLDQIRSLPDENAAEALERLPGIQMESDSGAGRFVNIRGMDADLNSTTYDGVRLMTNNPASPQGGARAVALDDLPGGILGGLEVIKTLTPDIDAEGLGGVVNIQPRRIPDGRDYVLDVSLGGGIETLRGSPVYKGDITAGARFFEDKISVIASYSFEQDHRGINDIEEDYINDPTVVPAGTNAFLSKKAYDDVQYRWYQYHRFRQGYGGGITFNPDDTTELYVRALHAGYLEHATKHEFVLTNLSDNVQSVNNATGDITSLGVKARYADINTKENEGENLVELGGSTLIADLVKADARISWVEGYDHWPYSTNTKFYDPSTTLSVTYNNLNQNHPTYQALGGVNLADPANYTQASGSNSPNDNTDTEYAGVTNFSFPLEVGGDQGVVKFGGSVRMRTRNTQSYNDDLNITDQNLTDYVSGSDITYYHNWYNIGPQPIYSKLLGNITPGTPTPDPSTYAHNNENVYAGYVQYSATFGEFDVVGGVRIEDTEGTYRANQFVTDSSGNTTMSLNTQKHSYTNVFPDVSVKYSASDDLQFRAAYSTSIARPGFNQITAARSIDLFNATPRVTQGNPDLLPIIGHNVDLTASYFLPHHGIASVALFYKSFDDYIIANQVTDKNYPGFVGQNVYVTTFSNIGGAHVAGVELDYVQQFDFLPGMLSGLGFDGNLTYNESRGQIRPGEKGTLPQTSPFAYNAALFYEKGPVNLKLAASYVSTNLWATGGSAATDIYSQPRFRLDFGATYDITDQVQAYFDAKNLSNTHLDFTQTKDKAFPIQNEFYGPDYLFGVRVRL